MKSGSSAVWSGNWFANRRTPKAQNRDAHAASLCHHFGVRWLCGLELDFVCAFQHYNFGKAACASRFCAFGVRRFANSFPSHIAESPDSTMIKSRCADGGLVKQDRRLRIAILSLWILQVLRCGAGKLSANRRTPKAQNRDAHAAS